MKSLCVFCGSRLGDSPAFAAAGRELGETLAARNIELVFGGSHVGLMGVVADAVLANGGRVVGFLPRFMADKELAHPNITELHLVDTMHDRKRMMAERAEGFVALPGGFGTLEEIFEAITWAQLHLHNYPCALLNVAGYYDSLATFLHGTVTGGFVKREHLKGLIVADTVTALFARFATFKPRETEEWVPKELI
jgi:uncharacterized protein (TIGR00730 family)